MRKRICSLVPCLLSALLLIGCGSVSIISDKSPIPIMTTPAVISNSSAENKSVSSSLPATSGISTSAEEKSQSETTDPISEHAAGILSGMDLHTKICQMLIVTPEALSGGEQVLHAGAAVMHMMHQYPVGGILLMADNIQSAEQTQALIRNLQCYAAMDLFIGVDEEGGCVSRVLSSIGSFQLEDMYFYREGGTDTAYANAAAIGTELLSLGINLDFAPVADVWTNPENTVIGTRAYSDDFAEAASLVAAAVQGFSDAGILCSLKHFPGHGDTAEDSHAGSAFTYRTLDEMRSGEFLPFEAGIAAGAPMVMAAHITALDLDDTVASLSEQILTGLLREELGFNGVIVTDALNMRAIADFYSSGDAAVMAIDAGADILLCPEDLEKAVAGIENAIEEGQLSEERINDSVLRILTLKISIGIL